MKNHNFSVYLSILLILPIAILWNWNSALQDRVSLFSSVRVGMPASEVKVMLGPPKKAIPGLIRMTSEPCLLWYYSIAPKAFFSDSLSICVVVSASRVIDIVYSDNVGFEAIARNYLPD